MAIGQELVLLKFSAVGWWWCSLSGKLAVSGNLAVKYVRCQIHSPAKSCPSDFVSSYVSDGEPGPRTYSMDRASYYKLMLQLRCNKDCKNSW